MANENKRTALNPWVTGIAGLILGCLLTLGVFMWLASGLMITEGESTADFEGTLERIRQAVEDQGWTVQSVVDMNKSLEKHGHPFDKRVVVIKICQPEYAHSILSSDRPMAVMMPCSIAVYEADDGSVMISQMNSGLMGSLYGGKVAEVMGGKVAPDVDAILDEVLK